MKGSINLTVAIMMMIPFLEASDTAQAQWPQWRGPNRDSVATGEHWPSDLNLDSLQKSWSLPLGPGYSGPIVAEGKVFVTETQGETYEMVRALDLHSGGELWKAQWEGAMQVPFFARKNGSWIRATPTYSDGHLYVAGMEDVLVCLDSNSGKIVWKMDFVDQFKTDKPTFGFVSSPLVDGNHLYVQAASSFLKMDKKTGTVLWRTLQDEGGMMGSAFSSPMITKINGRTQLVVQGRTHLSGVDPDDGSILWSREIPAFRGMNILTPAFYNNGIFTSSYRGRSYLFHVKEKGGAMSLERRWTSKAMAYMSSPVILGDFAYMHLQNRRLVCLDLRTGQERWRSSQRFGDYWSMVSKGNMIMALDEVGELILLKGNPEKLEIVSRKLVAQSSTWAHLAVAGHHLLIRELKAVTAWKLPPNKVLNGAVLRTDAD